MKTKQEMVSRSLYMPKTYWNEIDKIAESEESSSNTVIRRLVSILLTENNINGKPIIKKRTVRC